MLNIFTIVFNGEPYIERHLPIFEQLKVPWRWVIVHGPANNGGSTAWCKSQEAGLSTDGTTEYLEKISTHPNVTVLEATIWSSKDKMVEAAVNEIILTVGPGGVLLQIDSDELWLAGQLEKIVELFESDPSLGAMAFFCRYFVGPDLICVGEDCWSNGRYDWIRAWRFEPGMEVVSHEPPKFDRMLGRMMEREESRSYGLVFDHFSYVTEAQVRYKQGFYGPAYANALSGWRRMQHYVPTEFPIPLKPFFNWVDDRVKVMRLVVSPAACATVVK